MSEVERRRNLTFAQAEGLEALPVQLQRTQLSNQLIAQMWKTIYSDLMIYMRPANPIFRQDLEVSHPWSELLYNYYVDILFGLADRFSYEATINHMREDLTCKKYDKFYGVVQFLCQNLQDYHPLIRQMDHVLEQTRAAYRIIDGVVVPIGSAEDAQTVKQALSNLGSGGLAGPLAHLKAAIQNVSAGAWADSVRESIHAVEALARSITGEAELSKALNALSDKIHIHGAMKRGFTALYGYASDEQGIRHALLEDGDAKVTEADALFMLGACSAFVTYLTANARAAGLLESKR